MTRKRDGKVLYAVARYADGESEILYHGSLNGRPDLRDDLATVEANDGLSRTKLARVEPDVHMVPP